MIFGMEFPLLPPNNNAYIRMHWTVRDDVLNEWIVYVKNARNSLAFFPREPIKKCGIVWRLYVQRRRDWDNAAAMFKVVGDALRKSDMIENDSPVCVDWFRVEQVKLKKGEPERCLVEIWTYVLVDTQDLDTRSSKIPSAKTRRGAGTSSGLRVRGLSKK